MNGSSEQAEIVGLQALHWLIEQEEVLTVFMGSTGASAQDLKDGAKNPEFLGSLLDFILMDDAWVKEFCDTANLDYQAPYQYRQLLPGGDIPNWT